VHADGTLGFATPAKQITQRKMQLDGLGVDLGDLENGINRLVGLSLSKK
jgi:hypothetical protein